MQDMADATSEAASIASQYGVQVDELSAMIAVVTSKTRESGSEVGNALKSIFINLQDTTNKTITNVFDSVGISMTKMANGAKVLKTPIELLKELSDVFVSLDEGSILRANILSDIGGKYHANSLSSILADWSSFEKMLELYSQGTGSAFEESQKSANNLTGSLEKLHNSWIKLINTFIDAKELISGVNIAENTISGIQKIIDKFGLLEISITGVGTAIGTILQSKNKSGGLMSC